MQWHLQWKNISWKKESAKRGEKLHRTHKNGGNKKERNLNEIVVVKLRNKIEYLTKQNAILKERNRVNEAKIVLIWKSWR